MLPQLETKSLVLSEICLDDALEIDAYQKDDAQWRFQAVEPQELSDARFRIEKYFEHKGPDDQRRLFVLVAREKNTKQLIGQVSLSRSHPAIGDIGFGVDLNVAKQGFATQMVDAMVSYAFEGVKLHRLTAHVAPENKACIKVLEKLGMTNEGLLRDSIFAQGRWWSEHVFSKLETEHQSS